ncbi:hypothetical protein [Flavobacterium koreense]|jgi:uncharacterized membrane protein
MKPFKTIFAFLLFFVCTNSIAQSTNSQKIIGCWKVTKFELKTEIENSSEIIKDAINNEVCFDAKGNFITTNAEDKTIGNGTFNLSEDGKTIFQKSNDENNDIGGNAEIELLNEKTLILKSDYFTMSFEKK